MQKRKKINVDEVFFPEEQEEERKEEKEPANHQTGKPLNRQTIKTTLYIPIEIMKRVDMRRYELLEQTGRKATKSQIMVAALDYAVQDLERLQSLLSQTEF